MNLLLETLRKAGQIKKQAESAAPAFQLGEKASATSAVPIEPLSDIAPLTIEFKEEETALAEKPGLVLEAWKVPAGDRAIPPSAEVAPSVPPVEIPAAKAAPGAPDVPQSVARQEEQAPGVDSAPRPTEPEPAILERSGEIKSAETSRQVARTVFLAKKRQHRRGVRRRLLGYGLLSLLGIFGAAGFLYSSSGEPPMPVAPIPMLTDPSSGEPAPRQAAEISTTPAPAAETLTVTEAPESRDQGQDVQRSLPPENRAPAPMAGELKTPPTESLEAIPAGLSMADSLTESRYEPDPLINAKTEVAAPPSIRISKRAARPQHAALLGKANAAFEQGEYEQSRSHYLRILQAEPDHRGALLGLAALAVRSRDAALARDLYLRLLMRDPADPLAKAGLLSIMTRNDPTHLESELKLLLEVYPDLAPLSFLLGNVYASGQRWNEAQQAYFRAVQAAGKGGTQTPDYPFNLAVSLEHLGQPALATRYYREALALAELRPAGFDREALRRQLATLETGAR